MKLASRAAALAVAGAALLGSAPPARADVSLLGAQFVALGGSVTVRYLGSSALYFNTMQWFKNGIGAVNYRAGPNSNTVDYSNSGTVENLFYNRDGYDVRTGVPLPVSASAPGATVTLGGGYSFAPGEEVLLALFVNNEYSLGTDPNPFWAVQDADDYTYFSGPQARNKDNSFHLLITDLGGGTYRFQGGWEDEVNGGDNDFNDVMFEISGVTVTPEPVSMLLVGTGLAGIGLARRRRKQQQKAAV